ncbi:MAG: sulfotransferase [Pseudomonadota bacterium]
MAGKLDASGTAAMGTLDTALAHAAGLLRTQPHLALRQAREILRAVPGHPQAVLIEGQAQRLAGDLPGARITLSRLAAAQPRSAATAYELGLTAAALGEVNVATSSFRRAIALKPDLSAAWLSLAATLREAGREQEASQADLSAIRASTRDPLLLEAAVAMGEGRFEAAEPLLRDRLRTDPNDVAAIRMLGELAWRIGRIDDALALLRLAVERAPGFEAARELLLRILAQGSDVTEALVHADRLVADDPGNPAHAMLKASLLVRVGDQEGARAIYATLARHDSSRLRVWLNLGHVEKTMGNQAEAIAAYRRAIAINPAIGEAWWSLANLKTVELGDGDIAAMLAALDEVSDNEDAVHLHFALGKAYEDAGNAAESFAHYDRANRLRRGELDYDPRRITAASLEHAGLFSAPFLAARAGQGCPARDPVFIVGLPRAGSTLVEQILASHSMIEGTMELPDMMMIAQRLESRVEEGEFAGLGAAIATLSSTDLARLGEEYLDRTRVHRKTGKPRFIDKMPNNWQHVGLIRLILPNAVIIDARRHPMACCFSGWKQHFARGQVFSYDLAEIGTYYGDYVAQMAAFDRAAPGAVHRVIYERMVADTPGEVRRLLDHVGVPFEEACLEFWRTRRAVRTASSEQVRQPIFTDAVEHWRMFTPWLGPLETALGPLATSYPAVPEDLGRDKPAEVG